MYEGDEDITARELQVHLNLTPKELTLTPRFWWRRSPDSNISCQKYLTRVNESAGLVGMVKNADAGVVGPSDNVPNPEEPSFGVIDIDVE